MPLAVVTFLPHLLNYLVYFSVKNIFGVHCVYGHANELVHFISEITLSLVPVLFVHKLIVCVSFKRFSSIMVILGFSGGMFVYSNPQDCAVYIHANASEYTFIYKYIKIYIHVYVHMCICIYTCHFCYYT